MAKPPVKQTWLPAAHGLPAFQQLIERYQRDNHVVFERDVVTEIYDATRHGEPVLIEGETGTGKEMVAQAIHALGPRSKGPFVVVNCACLSESLAASELFGHRKGAFTGADIAHLGAFGRAEGGTLLLDEVADLPVAVQAMLLRAIDKRLVAAIGHGDRSVNVRVLAATWKPLDLAVHQGKFRPDLRQRLLAGRIQTRPLRERRAEFADLAAAVLAQAGLGGDPQALDGQAIGVLHHLPWRGNLRELGQVLSRAVRAGGFPPRAAELLAAVQHFGVAAPGQADSTLAVVPLPPPRRLDAARVDAALAASAGRHDRAAQLLNVHSTSLSRWLRVQRQRRVG